MALSQCPTCLLVEFGRKAVGQSIHSSQAAHWARILHVMLIFDVSLASLCSTLKNHHICLVAEFVRKDVGKSTERFQCTWVQMPGQNVE